MKRFLFGQEEEVREDCPFNFMLEYLFEIETGTENNFTRYTHTKPDPWIYFLKGGRGQKCMLCNVCFRLLLKRLYTTHLMHTWHMAHFIIHVCAFKLV